MLQTFHLRVHKKVRKDVKGPVVGIGAPSQSCPPGGKLELLELVMSKNRSP